MSYKQATFPYLHKMLVLFEKPYDKYDDKAVNWKQKSPWYIYIQDNFNNYMNNLLNSNFFGLSHNLWGRLCDRLQECLRGYNVIITIIIIIIIIAVVFIWL